MARPTKLTPELQEGFCDLLREGNFAVTVCDSLGIDERTYYNWMAWGERGHKADREAGYTEFFQSVKKAAADVEMTTLRELRQGVENWQSRAWWLERRYPNKWGNRGKRTHEISGPNGGPLEHVIKGYALISPDEWDADGNTD